MAETFRVLLVSTSERKECCTIPTFSTLSLSVLIKAINKTNRLTYIEGESITDIIAKRDALGLKLSVLRSFIDTASEKIDRYSNKEIKILSTVNVSEKQEEVDKLSKEYIIIDTKLQGLNWTIDLVE